MRRLPGPCAEADCPTITIDTRCAAHRRRSSRSPTWRAVRRAVLAARWRCELCGAPAVEVDHITAIADGGAELDPANLQALCHRCHLTKSAAEA